MEISRKEKGLKYSVILENLQATATNFMGGVLYSHPLFVKKWS